MIDQRHFGGHERFEIVALVAGSAAAPFGKRARRGVLGVARRGFGRFFGKDVVEPGIEGLFDFGAAAEIGLHPILGAGLGALTIAAAITTVGIGKLAAFGRLARHRRFAVFIGAVEQRIALQLLLDIGREVQIRQLQQLDRLHQLRRHHQRLRLAEFEALRQCHGGGRRSSLVRFLL